MRQIQDITSRLPHAVQNELQQRGEILEALIVTDESPFKSAAAGVQQAVLEAGVVSSIHGFRQHAALVY